MADGILFISGARHLECQMGYPLDSIILVRGCLLSLLLTLLHWLPIFSSFRRYSPFVLSNSFWLCRNNVSWVEYWMRWQTECQMENQLGIRRNVRAHGMSDGISIRYQTECRMGYPLDSTISGGSCLLFLPWTLLHWLPIFSSFWRYSPFVLSNSFWLYRNNVSWVECRMRWQTGCQSDEYLIEHHLECQMEYQLGIRQNVGWNIIWIVLSLLEVVRYFCL